MEKKLIIIDGNSLINRAFYAVPPLTDKKGHHTNAIYGFANILFKAIKEYEPTHFSVAFDLKAPTFRHQMYKDYKGTRKGMPDELAEQLEPLKQMLDYFGITTMELPGYEADDIIGTVAKHFEKENIKTLIITGDKDSFQLASDTVNILFTKKGISDLEIIDKTAMQEKYGLTSEEFIDLKALMGDTSDNIKGVAGIGEKTALKLIQEYKSIENLYKNIEQLKGATKKKLEDGEQSAYLSKKLATINTAIPIDFDTDELVLKGFDIPKLHQFFVDYNMISLVKKLKNFDKTESESSKNENIENSNSGENFDEKTSSMNDKSNEKTNIELSFDANELIQNISDKIFIKIVRENALVNIQSILSLCIISKGKHYLISENDINIIKNILEDEKIKKCSFDIKTDYLALLPYNITMKNLAYDLKIASYLLSPDDSNYDISDIAIRQGLDDIKSFEEFFGKGKSAKIINAFTKDEVENYYFEILEIVKNSYENIKGEIEKENMTYLFEQIEMPLISVLADMEYEGVLIDKDELERQKKDFANIISNLEQEIYDLAGEVFNINSPKQLGVILFEKLNLPVIKKTKTGYSTDVSVLEELSSQHEIVAKVISYRQYTKLQSTYVEGLLNIINPDTKRIHSSFNQTIAATGRISSTEPNLQNIPVRLEVGRNLRKAFIAKDGCLLADADYSQIELRVLAHISDEKTLIDAFASGVDIHQKTASEVFDTPLNEVTKEQRSAAKAVNFGIVYGISDFGLSNNLGITKKKAAEYIKNYLDSYKNIQKYMEEIPKQAEKDGYVTTILGRRRYIPQLAQKNFMIRNLGKRLAMNTPIQGSAADIIKIAMIKVSDRLKKEKLSSKLILTVHDELIIECPIQEKDKIAILLKEEMENAYKMKAQLLVEVNFGKSWFDSK